jgi:hypothetical protein
VNNITTSPQTKLQVGDVISFNPQAFSKLNQLSSHSIPNQVAQSLVID